VKPATDGGDSAPAFLGDYNAVGFLILLRSQAEALTRQDNLSEAWRYYEIEFELLRRIRLRAAHLALQIADSEEHALLESIVRWSAHPQQTKDRIAVALAKLEGIENQEPSNQHLAKIGHVLWMKFLKGEDLEPRHLGMPPAARALHWWFTLLPWERTRSLRLLTIDTRGILHPETVQEYYRDWKVMRRWQDTTLLGGGYATHRLDRMPTSRRAARILVALIDWRREHGSLPGSLQEIASASWSRGSLNVDPGQPFFYAPRGLPEDMVNERAVGQVEILLPKDNPFLWNPGQSGITMTELPDGRITARDNTNQEISLAKAIEQGQLWKIPSSTQRP
jgi:hypothetical protein